MEGVMKGVVLMAAMVLAAFGIAYVIDKLIPMKRGGKAAR